MQALALPAYNTASIPALLVDHVCNLVIIFYVWLDNKFRSQKKSPKPEDPTIKSGLTSSTSRVMKDVPVGFDPIMVYFPAKVPPFNTHLKERMAQVTSLEPKAINLKYSEALGDYINFIKTSTSINTFSYQSRVDKDQKNIVGEIDFKFDEITPSVYGVMYALLIDGFIYIADTKKFQITTPLGI